MKCTKKNHKDLKKQLFPDQKKNVYITEVGLFKGFCNPALFGHHFKLQAKVYFTVQADHRFVASGCFYSPTIDRDVLAIDPMPHFFELR